MEPIGVGIDIVDIGVFKKRLDSGMVEELFLPGEIDYCNSRARPWESFAGRFAAKEAVFKALGHGLAQGLCWKQVEVLKDDSGAVSVELSGKARCRADAIKVKSISISISHTRNEAVAVAIAQG
ncbi:MAG: holo-[acyl-carrier-protein] synthase [Candidatus Aegiribacteria sp.]|nr:holo-[acyl-carrier-protein] synthase [Candidatus Aegiribacteria sp.]MBD3295185.1 holo-[acyl-carrier-protein] synthase [Candidatus Fermentibacteria bacterium]